MCLLGVRLRIKLKIIEFNNFFPRDSEKVKPIATLFILSSHFLCQTSIFKPSITFKQQNKMEIPMCTKNIIDPKERKTFSFIVLN